MSVMSEQNNIYDIEKRGRTLIQSFSSDSFQ